MSAPFINDLQSYLLQSFPRDFSLDTDFSTYSCQLDWSGAKQVSVVSFLIIDRAAREYILQHAIAIYFVGQDHQTSMSCLSAHAYIDGAELIYYP